MDGRKLDRKGRSGMTVELLPLVLLDRTEMVDGGLSALDWDGCFEWRRRGSLIEGMMELEVWWTNSDVGASGYMLEDVVC